MSDVYGQHDKAFAQVSAWVILDEKGDRVATVAIKFPPPGHGERRLWAYCHAIGLPMQRHYAGGYGYDKRTPAVAGAFVKAWHARDPEPGQAAATAERIVDALTAPSAGGEYWDRLLEKAGFRVLQAV